MSVTYNFVEPLKDPEWISGKDILPLLENVKNPVGIEIGVDEAPTSWFFLKNRPDLKLYGVDPFQGYQDWYPGGFISQGQQDEKYINMQRRTEEFGDRWKHYRLTSDDAVRLFDDNAYDFIFIDGLHTYEQLTKDCANYYRKLKTGGVFAGHDYNAIEGVRRAADQFADSVGKQILLTECDVWYWIK